MVNDICGFADPEMPEVCREYDVAVGKMASPPDLERPGAIEDVDEIHDALFQNGLTEKTIIDPAFGGWSEDKTTDIDRETFQRLEEFRAIGHPMLVSINRKNFLREIAGRSTEEALPVSLAATSMAVERGADVIRTHDVAETRDAALVGDAFSRNRSVIRTPTGVEVEALDASTGNELRRHVQRIESGGPSPAREHQSVEPKAHCARTVELRNLPAGKIKPFRERANDSDVLLASGDSRLLVGGLESTLLAFAQSLDTTELADAVRTVLGGKR
jgi:dihydropteroate synthase